MHVSMTQERYCCSTELCPTVMQKLALLLLPQGRIKSLTLVVTAIECPLRIHAPMWLWSAYAKAAFSGPPKWALLLHVACFGLAKFVEPCLGLNLC